MPYYEYLCDEGHEFEVEQRITDDPLTKCTTILADSWNPVRCGFPCRRQISDTSFKFKDGPPTPKHYQ